MFSFLKNEPEDASALIQSELFDEKTFYQQFIADLYHSKKEVIIESPFITSSRIEMLYPVFEMLVSKNVKIFVFTRDPREHAEPYDVQSERAIQWFEQIGVQTLLCKGNHHRKLAMIDREILYEGSLNILSQTKSREIMRRIQSDKLTLQMFEFLKYKKYL